jgi:hypothetical protein
VKHEVGDAVLLTWIDHSGGTMGWQSVDDFKDPRDAPYVVKTLGFVVNQNKDRITVVQNYSINDMVNHHMTLEKKLIREIKVVKKGHK